MTTPNCSARHRRGFPHTAHLHTEMMSFQKNGHTVWMKYCFQCIRDLLTDPFLHCEAFGEKPNQTGQFGNANDALMSDVSNISRIGSVRLHPSCFNSATH
jgi:hypothetical protein